MSEQMRLPGTSRLRQKGRNYRAVNKTVRLLRQSGRIEPVDEARVALARSTAEAVDDALARPDTTPHKFAAAAGKHTEALDRLYGNSTDDGPTLADLFAPVEYSAGEPPF